jgi:hypothetical protein
MATVEIESWPVLNEKCSAGGRNKGTIEAQRCHIFRAAGNAMFMFEGNVLFRGAAYSATVTAISGIGKVTTVELPDAAAL